MAGADRRARRIRQSTTLSELGGLSLVNPTGGQLLGINSITGLIENVSEVDAGFQFGGPLVAPQLNILNDAAIVDDLVVGGDTTLNGPLTANNAVTLNGATTIGDTLTVLGDAEFQTALAVAGALTGSGFSFDGDGTIDGELVVLGNFASGAIATTNLLVAGSFTATGPNLFGSAVDVMGALTSTTTITGASLIGTTSVSTPMLVTTGTLSGPQWRLTKDADTLVLACDADDGTLILRGRFFEGAPTNAFVDQDMLTLAPLGTRLDLSDNGGVASFFTPTGTLSLTNESDSGIIVLQGRNSTSTLQTLLTLDPDNIPDVTGVQAGNTALASLLAALAAIGLITDSTTT